MVGFLFIDDLVIPETIVESVLRKDGNAGEIIEELMEVYESISDFSHDVLYEATKNYCETKETSLRKVQAPIRAAITGAKVGPPLFESLEILGREKTLARLAKARVLIGTD